MPEAATLFLALMCLATMTSGAIRLFLMWKGATHSRREQVRTVDFDDDILLTSDLVPDVSIIAAAPDASAESIRFVRQLVKLYFGRFEVVVVLDGPDDSQVDVWKREFHLENKARAANGGLATKKTRSVYASTEPISLLVVVKEEGGEADALNAGVNLATSPVIATVDWGAEFAAQTLVRLIRPMVADPTGTLAVSALAPPLAAATAAGHIYRLQFLKTWLSRCAGLASWNAFLPAPGAFILFQRAALLQARGFRCGPGGCELEMIIRLHVLGQMRGMPNPVRLISEPVSRPANVHSYRDMRGRISREQAGIAAALAQRLGMIFNFGPVGGLAIPGLFWSRLLLPVMETVCLALAVVAVGAHWVALSDVALLMAGATVFGILVSMTATLLESAATASEVTLHGLVAQFFAAIPENVGYRQWSNLRMIYDFARGFRAS